MTDEIEAARFAGQPACFDLPRAFFSAASIACASESTGADDVDVTDVTLAKRPNPARPGFDGAGVFRPNGSTGTAVAPLIGD
jgi:hypothetical protein